MLVDSFIDEYNSKMDKNIKGVSKKVMDLFMEYDWPGNVRELKHIIESAFNFTEEDVIEEEQLPEYIRCNQNSKMAAISIDDNFCLNTAIKDFEIKYIKLALENSSTLNEAAKLLKISRQTLKYKMDVYGIEFE